MGCMVGVDKFFMQLGVCRDVSDQADPPMRSAPRAKHFQPADAVALADGGVHD